jgi:tripartite-type tricarboxylate transporter receptor subunit TctC
VTDSVDRRIALSLLAGAGLAPALPPRAAAGVYPEHPIHVVVPFTPGGAVDIVARTVMQAAGPQLHQAIVVDNRPGASGNIAPAYVARAAPDGYTMLIGANGLATNPSLFSKLPFDVERDLLPVALVGYTPLILVVKPDFAAKTVKDLVAMAKAAPDSLTYGSAGNGTSGHLASEVFKQVAGIEALHVPYKGGAQALIDLMGGRISFTFLDPLQVMSEIRAKELRPIAVSSLERLALLPDVPTVAESGYPGFEATVWWGFLLPAHTPDEIVARLNGVINIALQDAQVRDTLLAMGMIIKGGTPEEFRAFLKSETEKWAAIIKTANIKAD